VFQEIVTNFGWHYTLLFLIHSILRVPEQGFKFNLIIFRRELSQISPTVCLINIISKIALKQGFIMVFDGALPKQCFVGITRRSPLSRVLYTWIRNLSKRMELSVFY